MARSTREAGLHSGQRRLSAGLVALLSACGGHADPDPPGVVLFVVDTLRADVLSAYGGPVPTPALERLAADGLAFEAAYAQATHTHASMSSAFTGLVPPRHGVLGQGGLLHEGVVPAPAALRARGVATGAFVANLCRLQGKAGTVWTDGWEQRFCGEAPGTDQHLWDRAVLDAALAWIGERDGPYLAWIHLMDPHLEHRPPPDQWDREAHPLEDKGDQDRRFTGYERAGLRPPASELAELEALYAAEVRGVDAKLARLLDELDALGRGSTAVVFTADHGEELFETWPKYGHGLSLTEGVLRVPLVIRAPGVAPGSVEEPVELLQLAPTLLQLLAVDTPLAFDGPSLLGPQRGFARSFCGEVASLRSGDLRAWVRSPLLQDPPEFALFHARAPYRQTAPWLRTAASVARYDPGSPRDPELVTDETELVETLEAMLAELDAPPDLRALDDPAFLQTLRDLGYL